MGSYDSIIIGAGHNGLVCATYLARAGQRVLVLEAGDSAGGLVADREFHPGFHVSIAHSVGHFSSRVLNDLNLSAHGFSAKDPMPFVALSKEGNSVAVENGELRGVSESDASAYRACNDLLQRCASALRPFWDKTMPRIGSKSIGDLLTFAHVGWNLRRLGRNDMHEFMRIASLPARDLMDEYFENEAVKALLSWDGLIGSRLAPRSPNSAVLAMLYRLSEGSLGNHVVPKGGAPALASAIQSAAESAGVELRLNAAVEKIRVDGNDKGLCTTGVRLSDGSEITAERVISSADPKTTFFDLVGVQNLDIGFTNQVRRLRCDGYVAKLHLALDGLPDFQGINSPNGRMIIAPSMDAIEFAFDDAKYGQCSEQPVMEIVVPSVHDNSLAPSGQHVLSAHVMYVPRKLKGGWNAEARDAIRERAIDTIANYAPGIHSQILHSELLTPEDLESQYRVTGGHWHHTEFAMDQMLMMRPTYGAAQYNSPIPGLHLCGAGSHPGGDLVGAAGRNAANEILK